MRIALLSYEYPPETGFGGIGTYTWHQARALRALGHEVHVLAGAMEPRVGPGRTEEDGITVWRHRSPGVATRLLRGLGRWRLWWTRNRLENALSMHEGLRAIRRQVPIDIVEMPECGAEGLLLGRLQDVPTVVKFHSPAELIMGSYDVTATDTRLCSALERLAFSTASAHVSASRFLAHELRTRMGFREPMDVVPNGLDLGWFDANEPTDIRTRFGIPADRPMVLFAGRMEARKGIHLCGEIAGPILERHEVAFVFVGQDLFGYMERTLLPSLRRRRLRGSVHFLGRLGLEDVRSCLLESDIVLMPSLWENCPYSCLEAMAAGRAVVSSDAGGLPELVRDGRTGLLARTGHPAGFVVALERLLGDPALGAQLGSAARGVIELEFSHLEIGRRSTAIYERVLGGAGRP